MSWKHITKDGRTKIEDSFIAKFANHREILLYQKNNGARTWCTTSNYVIARKYEENVISAMPRSISIL